MKKNSIHILATAAIALCAGTTLPFLLSNTQLNEQESIKSEVPYCVTPPYCSR